MDRLIKFLYPLPTLTKIDYNSRRLVVLMIDARPIEIGWAIRQDDDDRNMFEVRFGAKVFNS